MAKTEEGPILNSEPPFKTPFWDSPLSELLCICEKLLWNYKIQTIIKIIFNLCIFWEPVVADSDLFTLPCLSFLGFPLP